MDAGASRARLIGNALLLQNGNHLAGILRIHPAIQQGEIRAAGEEHHRGQHTGDQQAGGGHGHFLVHAQLLPDAQQLHA